MTLPTQCNALHYTLHITLYGVGCSYTPLPPSRTTVGTCIVRHVHVRFAHFPRFASPLRPPTHIATPQQAFLNANWNPLGRTGGIGLIRGVSESRTLVSLNLAFCQLDDRAGVLLGDALAQPRPPPLKELNISHNNLRRRTGHALAEALASNDTLLMTLRCGFNAFGFAATQAIVQALRTNKTLVQLGVENCAADDGRENIVEGVSAVQKLWEEVQFVLEERTLLAHVEVEFPVSMRRLRFDVALMGHGGVAHIGEAARRIAVAQRLHDAAKQRKRTRPVPNKKASTLLAAHLERKNRARSDTQQQARRGRLPTTSLTEYGYIASEEENRRLDYLLDRKERRFSLMITSGEIASATTALLASKKKGERRASHVRTQSANRWQQAVHKM